MPPLRTFDCPVCGQAVPLKAKACPSCGACEKTGWNVDSDASDGLDLPDDEFNYEKFVQDEFGQPAKPRGKEMLWWITALILVVVMILGSCFNALFR
jgi:predicted nucleic acid-binding Zn ribbon protein